MIETALKYFLADFCLNKMLDSVIEKFSPLPSTELQVGDELVVLFVIDEAMTRKRISNVTVKSIDSKKVTVHIYKNSLIECCIANEWQSFGDTNERIRCGEITSATGDPGCIKSFVRK